MPSEFASRKENYVSSALRDVRPRPVSRRRRWDSLKELPPMPGAFPSVPALSLGAAQSDRESTRTASSLNPTSCSERSSTSDAFSDYRSTLRSIEMDDRMRSHTGRAESSKGVNSTPCKLAPSPQMTKLEEALTRLKEDLRDKKEEVDSLALENAQLREQVANLQQKCIVGERQLQMMGRDTEVAQRAAEQVQRQHKEILSLLQQICGEIQRMNSEEPAAESALQGAPEERESSPPPHQERRRSLREKIRKMRRDVEDFVQTKGGFV